VSHGYEIGEMLANWNKPAPVADKSWIVRQINELQPDEYITFSGAVLDGLTPDEIMGSVVGSSFSILYYVDAYNRTVSFRRLPKALDDGRRTWVYPDVRHFYEEDGDGLLQLRAALT
jgi:hypothetical protein